MEELRRDPDKARVKMTADSRELARQYKEHSIQLIILYNSVLHIYIYIYIYNIQRERERDAYIYIYIYIISTLD